MTILHHPNPGKKLDITIDQQIWRRFPVQTKTIGPEDDLLQIFLDESAGFVQAGDVVLLAESVLAITEGRAYQFSDIKYGRMANFLSKRVTSSTAGIGLGTPQTMQLALNEAGGLRILLAAAVAAITRPLGLRGMFYRIAGPKARGIDGPTAGTLPPYDNYASLIPADPFGFVKKAEVGFSAVQFVVIDANDIGVNILSARSRSERALATALCQDNPLGQGSERTPFLICRRLKENEPML